LLSYRRQAFECLEDMLARMVDHPVSSAQSAAGKASREDHIPYLGQPFFHRALLCLLDGDLEPLRFAGAFWVWRCTANGTIGSFVHLSSTVSRTGLGHRRRNLESGGLQILHGLQGGRKATEDGGSRYGGSRRQAEVRKVAFELSNTGGDKRHVT
jgi:hypothetical protein